MHPLVDRLRATLSRAWDNLRAHNVRYVGLAGILCVTLLLVLREADVIGVIEP